MTVLVAMRMVGVNMFVAMVVVSMNMSMRMRMLQQFPRAPV